eukprot:1157744-Pyramimonas_sp.AAC.1
MTWTASRRPDVSLVSHAEHLKLWELSRPLECPSWNKSQAPISRNVLSLKRAGWHAEGPLSWIDHQDLKVDLSATLPALLAAQMEA